MRGLQSISQKKAREWVGRHLLFWSVYLLGFTLIKSGQLGFVGSLKNCLILWPLNVVLVYVMIYGLLPRLLHLHYRQFFGLLAGYLCAALAAHVLFQRFVSMPTGVLPGRISVINNAICDYLISLVVVGKAAGVKLVVHFFREQEATQQLADETLLAELQMLKAQVHPHFLFNTLNTLYSLTLKQAANAPNMIQKLLEMLQYMLHDCNASTVPLSQEIALLENYIGLEKLRYGNRLVITMTVDGQIDNNVMAPLLLIPFVENAFKHGSSQQTGLVWIDLRLSVDNQKMTFRLANSTDASLPRSGGGRTLAQSVGGIGLANVKKRLSLLYPDAHTLSIHAHDGQFVVELTLLLGTKIRLVSTSVTAKPTYAAFA